MNEEFKEKFEQFIAEYSDHKTMVLSTSYNDRVTSRMMSIIQLDGDFYFQADIMSRKAEQILYNKNVSLCIDNIQIDGHCEIVGIPLKNANFCKLFQKYFSSAYELYSRLENERLFAVKPVRIQKWVYENNKPYVEIFDFQDNTYTKTMYFE